MVGFVDNTTGQKNKFKANDVTPEELINKMKHDNQIWFDPNGWIQKLIQSKVGSEK